MTIPTLVQEFKVKTAVSKIKKFYAVMDSAFRMGMIENGTINNWLVGTDLAASADNVMEIIKPHLKVIKSCKANDKTCNVFGKTMYKGLNNGNYGNFDDFLNHSKLQLADGSSLLIGIHSICTDNIKNNCGDIHFDINGENPPNKLGVDAFYLRIYPDRIVPQGAPNQEMKMETYCSRKNANSFGCAAWVIYNGNMDYLNCDNLSWDGKKTCK